MQHQRAIFPVERFDYLPITAGFLQLRLGHCTVLGVLPGKIAACPGDIAGEYSGQHQRQSG
ncbi:MAG: hypothetical protein QF384_22785, partial [Alphaproteobacteria bacterium]|nr:hypothetical protein [Alphaproteobacteria bacterium]